MYTINYLSAQLAYNPLLVTIKTLTYGQAIVLLTDNSTTSINELHRYRYTLIGCTVAR